MEGFFVFLFLLWIVVAILVFFDALSNSSQSAVLWGLVAFFGGILGVLLYALLGRDGEQSGRSAGGGRSSDRGRSRHRRAPSHVCRSCGEEYFLDRAVEIETCRRCGGVRVEAE